jgi:hypothetical protein
MKADDTKAIFKTKKMTTLDITREFEKLSRIKAPKEVETQQY